MKLNIDVGLTVRPERNPDLGLPAMVSTRRGVTVCGPIASVDHQEIVMMEVRSAMRAIEHWIARWQAGEIEAPPAATEPKLVLMTDELWRILGAGRVEWHESFATATFEGEEVPVYSPSMLVDVS